MSVSAGNQLFWLSTLQPSLTTAPHSSGWNGFVLTPRCFLTILGATVSTPRLVASHLPPATFISLISDIFFIRSGEDAPAEFRPLHSSMMASAFGIKSLLSQP